MMKVSVLKYYLLYLICFSYIYVMEFPFLKSFMSWDTPYHIIVLMRIVIIIFSICMIASILSCLAEQMTSEKDSLSIYGNKKLSSFWYNLLIPFIAYGVYEFESMSMIVVSILFYIGMNCIVSNHNKHVDNVNKQATLRKARQEQAEKVTLP